MAIGKKSFTVYCDWKATFDALPNDKAGELIKHLFAYVNDENPKSDDVLINAVFANIKATLKRDLKKWEKRCETNRKNAIKGGKANAQRIANEAERLPNGSERMPNKPDSDSDSDKEIISKLITKEKFIELWNVTRKDVLNKPSYLNKVNFNDLQNLNGYTSEQIRMALRGFFKQKTFPNGQDYTTNTKHFLERIEVYLQSYYDKNPNLWGKN